MRGEEEPEPDGAIRNESGTIGRRNSTISCDSRRRSCGIAEYWHSSGLGCKLSVGRPGGIGPRGKVPMDSPALMPLRLDGRTVDLQRGSVTDQAGRTATL